MLRKVVELKNIFHFFICLILLSIFLNQFGIPAYKNLIKQDVVFKETRDVQIESPSITVCIVCYDNYNCKF